MSITAKIYIEHERMALAPTLSALDDVKISVITQGTTDPGSKVFPFYVEYGDERELERTFDEDPTIDSYELVEWSDDTGVYYIEHTPETKLISSIVTEVKGYMVHTETTGHGWLVRLLLPDRGALNTIWAYAREQDITFEIYGIYGNEDANGDTSYGLTDEQRVTLETAYAEGYFEEPRGITLNDLADAMDLSATATSGRLRRGMRNLVGATLVEDESEIDR